MIVMITRAVSGLGWVSSCFTWYSETQDLQDYVFFSKIGLLMFWRTHHARQGLHRTWRSPSSPSRSRRQTSSSPTPPHTLLAKKTKRCWQGCGLIRGMYQWPSPCSRWSSEPSASHSCCLGVLGRPSSCLVTNAMNEFLCQLTQISSKSKSVFVCLYPMLFFKQHQKYFCPNVVWFSDISILEMF